MRLKKPTEQSKTTHMQSITNDLSGKYFTAHNDKINLKLSAPPLEKTELEKILDHEKSQGLIKEIGEPWTLDSAKHLNSLTKNDAIDTVIQLALKRFFIISKNLTTREKLKILLIFLQNLSDAEQKTAHKLKKHLGLSDNNATRFIYIINAGIAICWSIKYLLSPPPSNAFFNRMLHIAACKLYKGDQRPYRENKKTRAEASALGGAARHETYYKPIKERLTERLNDLPLAEKKSASEALEIVLPTLHMSHEEERRIMHAGSKRLLIKWTKEIQLEK